MTAYITPADIKARVPEEVYLQLFDRDNDGVVSETPSSHVDAMALAQAINASQAVVDTELVLAYPEGLTANAGVVDERIKGAQVQIALYEAVRYGPLSREGGPYRVGFEDAVKLLSRIRRGDGVLSKTAAGGAKPLTRTGSVQNAVLDTGSTSLPYTRAADGRDSSDF